MSQARGEAESACRYSTFPYASTRKSAGSNPAFLHSVAEQFHQLNWRRTSKSQSGNQRRRTHPRWSSCFHRRLAKPRGLAVGGASASVTGNMSLRSLPRSACTHPHVTTRSAQLSSPSSPARSDHAGRR
jgi:hypothetical protein